MEHKTIMKVKMKFRYKLATTSNNSQFQDSPQNISSFPAREFSGRA